MAGVDDDGGGARRRARPGPKERKREKASREPLSHDQAFQSNLEPTSVLGTWRALVALVAVLMVSTKVFSDWQHGLNMADANRLQREHEQKLVNQGQHRHVLALQKPGTDLLRDAREVVGTPCAWPLGGNDRAAKANAIISKLDYEKFQVSSGAWKFTCNASLVEASLRAKLGDEDNVPQGDAQHLPKAVINQIIKSLQIYDDEVVEHKRNFVVDGGLGARTSSQGHMYQMRLRSKLSGNKISVALMASSVTFDMRKVVDYIETQEEPVYEFVAVPKKSTRKCTTRTNVGHQCVFPFEHGGQRFLQCTTRDSILPALWCATSTHANDKMLSWGHCDRESCTEEEEPGPNFVKKFVSMAQKKFPVYSHRVLPEGVTQPDLLEALDVVASQEAVKVLSN